MKHPLSQASILSKISFAWLIETFMKGYRRELAESDLFPPLQNHSSPFLDDRIHKYWKKEIKEKSRSRPSLTRVILKSFGTQIMILGMIQLFVDAVVRTSQPFLIVKVLTYFIKKNEMTENEACYWAAGLILSLFIQSYLSNYVFNTMMFVGMKIRIASSCLIFRKVLKTSIMSLGKNTTLGHIINLSTNDVNNLEAAMPQLHFSWTAPIQAIVMAALVSKFVSLSAAAGISVFFLFLPIQVLLGIMAPRISLRAASKTDERLRLTNEIVNCVQVIKMFAWEKSFVPLVESARNKEMKDIMKMNVIRLNASATRVYISKFALLTSLLACITFNHLITAETVFLLTAFYNDLQNTMSNYLPLSLQQIANAVASIRRIEDFMMHDDIEYTCNNYSTSKPSENTNCEETPTVTVNLENISARWSPDTKEETLRDINFSAKPESLTSVIGQVASGKSSLLYAILHELPTFKGSMNLVGEIAYVSQDPWIFSSSIRKNILFNKPMDQKRYEHVVKVCQLERDFFLLPNNDQTIIGEKGINLSGGQKARIALARAVYQNADIYLLDDPLSAVDARVGRLIFEQCICKFLKNKTRILVTHQLQYLKDVDYIYVLKEGRVEKEGTYQEMKESLADLHVDDGAEGPDDRINQQFEVNDYLEPLNIISNKEQEEKSETDTFGKISGSAFLAYLKSVGNAWIIVLYSICVLTKQTTISGSEYFISNWATVPQSCGSGFTNVTNPEQSFVKCSDRSYDSWWHVYIYSGLLVMAIIATYSETFIFCQVCQMASQGLHSSMFYTMIRGAMSFFYKNSTGRIINRFSKDLGGVDKDMPKSLNDVIRIILIIVFVIIFCCMVNYWFAFGITFLAIILSLGVNFYAKTSRSLKVLDAITRSPILKHINDTLNGLPTIHASRAEVFLTKELHYYQDHQTSAFSLYVYSVHALRLYTDMIIFVFIIIVVYTFVITGDKNSVGNVGLILTQIISLFSILRWGVFQVTEMENYMTSVRRILEFNNIPQESSLETSLDKKPPKEWPQEGCVEFRSVFLKYYHQDYPVLKNLNFIAHPKEKIGIVGRTGAGKSSLVAALFRLAHMEGEIIIDGVSTSGLGLFDLRSKISIIPQQPLLFSGTLRRNLDPFEEYSDDFVWQALEDVELKNSVVDLTDGLRTKISDGGLNFSVGQRQLLCLARAIVKQNTILVLDEATANVDTETDSLIQKTIRKRFENCTVFIIAHRLNTIMDCDKCMVIDDGRIVEFDHPFSLLDKKEGFLYNMVQETGPETAALLTKISRRAKLK